MTGQPISRTAALASTIVPLLRFVVQLARTWPVSPPSAISLSATHTTCRCRG